MAEPLCAILVFSVMMSLVSAGFSAPPETKGEGTSEYKLE